MATIPPYPSSSDDPQAATATGRNVPIPTIPRLVVSNFIFRHPDGDESRDEVALFRRSDKVSTYRGNLAPVSGGVEPEDDNLLATALREIREETSLDSNSLELIRIGKPFHFIDEAIGREWLIHPFAWRLKDAGAAGAATTTNDNGISEEESLKLPQGEAGISLDYEHVGYEWHDPLLVTQRAEFGGVPRLVESLGRVWPEVYLGRAAGRELTAGLKDLQDDHSSGARQLADKSVKILYNVIQAMHPTRMDDMWWAKVRMAAWHISKNGRESMGSATNSAMVQVLNAMHHEMETNKTDDPYSNLLSALVGIDQTLECRAHAADQLLQVFVGELRRLVRVDDEGRNNISILTLSNSSTITSCLFGAAEALQVHMDIRILESRPLCEGADMAVNLLRKNNDGYFKITLFTDASAAYAARGVDLVLLGADAIAKDGDVSNKMGSLPAVLCARHVNNNNNNNNDDNRVKVMVLSDADKVVASAGYYDKDLAVQEENSPTEVTMGWWGLEEGLDDETDGNNKETSFKQSPHAAVKNRYFEWVPASLIDAYITDQGCLTLENIQERSRHISEQLERFFLEL